MVLIFVMFALKLVCPLFDYVITIDFMKVKCLHLMSNEICGWHFVTL